MAVEGRDSKSSCDVLIAGAGPVGLSLAIELGRRDVDCILVERRDGEVSVPKMSAVSARNMEFCRRWGIADKVRNAIWAEGNALDFVYLTSLVGRELARMKVPSHSDSGRLAYTPEGGCHCPQIYFDPILASCAESFRSVDLRYFISLETFDQHPDGVEALLCNEQTGERFTLDAAYVVGCDGAGGTVRRVLDIGLGGEGVVAQSLNIFFRSPELAEVHDKGWARFYRAIDHDGCWAELIAIDGRELWRLTVFDVLKTPGSVEDYLRRVVGRDFRFEVISASPWERRDAVAESYGRGRVFLAGDAVHQCSPTGGLGMHTGIEDAVNLGWKLEASLKGWGGEMLLASYELERLPIGQRNVTFATRAFRQISGIPAGDRLAEESEEGARQRDAFAAATRDLRRFSVSEIDKAQYCYEESPICVPDGSPPPTPSPDYVPTARPGTRAPHGWISDGVSMLDLYGEGFVLLDFSPSGAAVGDDALERAMASAAVPFSRHHIADPGIAEDYGARHVLVRPDGHVAWRGDTFDGDMSGIADRIRGA